ncbi:delta-lactam-biosynthetic de-N-acetylase [Paenibacillus algicola]|uniref:delta-lactam-biosynthetic de-N-acetylase n=1 Tax=Paenibacillus algicola TaxID=2565926 RepID=UPI0038994EE6
MKPGSRWLMFSVLLLCTALLTYLLLPASVHGEGRAFHFGFKKSEGGKLPSIDQEGFKELLKKHGAVFMGDPARKDLYLTFDNGYENGFTPAILDTLKAKQVPAAFFVTGHYVRTQGDLLKRMTAEGHIIGNHSWSHPDVSAITEDKLRQELDRVKSEVNAVTGQQEMKYLRTPRGIFNERSLAVSKEMGYTNVFWSIAYMDWDVNAQKGPQHALQKVTAQLHPGAVLLLHSISRDNAEALGDIIDEARKQGYEFRSLDEMDTKLP